MRVVHISYRYGTNNTGGAAIAATRLHKALLAHGVESHYICVWQCESGENVHVLPMRGSLARRFYLGLTRALRGFWKITRYRRSIPMHLVPLFGLERLLDDLKPDVIHVHWINMDVLNFRQLKKLRCKVAINLHDLFMLNIMEPYPGTDTRYIEGVNSNNSSWLERWLFNRKKAVVQHISPIFIGPSKWVCECAKRSIIGQGCDIYDIPNIIDPAFSFKPGLVAPHDKFVILFGAVNGRRNKAKGFADLEKAIALLPEPMKKNSELWIFGESAYDCSLSGLRTHFLGEITSPRELAALYHKADVFAFPSVEETQGMTKVEAMVCGAPVIVFDRTACAEGIENGITGWVVQDGDIKSYAGGIEYYYNLFVQGKLNLERRIGIAAKMQGFNSANIVEKIQKSYGKGAAHEHA